LDINILQIARRITTRQDIETKNFRMRSGTFFDPDPCSQ
jgi:hypothetical protein